MSCVTHVWDGPEPTSVRHAADLQAELARRAAPPSPKLLAFASLGVRLREHGAPAS